MLALLKSTLSCSRSLPDYAIQAGRINEILVYKFTLRVQGDSALQRDLSFHK